MVISFPGIECVKIQKGDTTIVFNPISKASKFKMTQFGADICIVSAWHDDMNGVEQATRGDKEPFVVKGPGEYEVSGYFIRGYRTQSEYGGKVISNTIYTLTIEDVRIAFLGALSETELSPEIKEEIGSADILFVPIGGEGVLSPQEAYSLAVKREPHIIIPIHYGKVGEKDALKAFLKEGGIDTLKAEDKVTLRKKDVDAKEGEIIVLKQQI